MTKYIGIQILFLSLLFTCANFAQSDVPDSQNPEVQHLLEFVETSDCTFERNGKKYDGADAANHIKRKYKYFKNKITTTEEFIEYSGTKSTMSGKPYLIYCGDKGPITSQNWLLEELTLYRQNTEIK